MEILKNIFKFIISIVIILRKLNLMMFIHRFDFYIYLSYFTYKLHII